MSMFDSEIDQMQGLSDAMRSTIDSKDAGNYADLFPEQGQTLADLLDDLAAIAQRAPGEHDEIIDRAYAWSAALTGNLG
jgi:hypothetical protein